MIWHNPPVVLQWKKGLSSPFSPPSPLLTDIADIVTAHTPTHTAAHSGANICEEIAQEGCCGCAIWLPWTIVCWDLAWMLAAVVFVCCAILQPKLVNFIIMLQWREWDAVQNCPKKPQKNYVFIGACFCTTNPNRSATTLSNMQVSDWFTFTPDRRKGTIQPAQMCRMHICFGASPRTHALFHTHSQNRLCPRSLC